MEQARAGHEQTDRRPHWASTVRRRVGSFIRAAVKFAFEALPWLP